MSFLFLSSVLPKTFFRQKIHIPVSYTHLDVYKRQDRKEPLWSSHKNAELLSAMTSPFEKKKRKKVLTVLISIFVILFIAILGLDSSLKTQFYQLDSDKISGRLRIALVSDLHSCAYGEEQDELIQAIVLQKPDLVLLCGDICDDILPRHNTEALLKGIAYRYPCYYVTGNHEYWSHEFGSILQMFRSYGIIILNGSYNTVKIQKNSYI